MTREEAIKILRDTHDKALFSVRNALETLIPELTESEDEKIRKFICSIIDNLEPKDFVGVKKMNVFAYLEKQKEQKPVDDVSKEEYVKRFKALCDAYEIKLPNREYDIYHLCDDLSKLSIDSDKQKPAEWSEEDEDYMKDLMDYFGHNLPLEHTPHAVRDWLKDLPNRITLQPKQEWSEEDEKMLNNLIWTVHMKSISPCDEMDDGNVYEKYESFLKSLRPSWKPSEEQMDRLFSIIAALRKDYCDDMADFLANLRADLKKLGVKEEPEYYQHFDPDC